MTARLRRHDFFVKHLDVMATITHNASYLQQYVQQYAMRDVQEFNVTLQMALVYEAYGNQHAARRWVRGMLTNLHERPPVSGMTFVHTANVFSKPKRPVTFLRCRELGLL